MKIFISVLILLLSSAYSLVLWKYPDIMLSPGSLSEGHVGLEHDCFRCHDPFGGTPRANCIACHKPNTIGIETVGGKRLDTSSHAFHTLLGSVPCFSCHPDHVGLQPDLPKFEHRLLADSLLSACAHCHESPSGGRHQPFGTHCNSCHTFKSWKDIHFTHGVLSKEDLDRCSQCHIKPDNPLHKNTGTDCNSCHGIERWKPATFDHDKYFVLDRHHQTQCSTCHSKANFDEYSCYGCHEHSPAKIAREHREEGILSFEDCARCHRDAAEHDKSKGGRRGKKDDHDNDED